MSQMRVVTIGTIFSHCLTLYMFALYRHIEQTNPILCTYDTYFICHVTVKFPNNFPLAYFKWSCSKIVQHKKERSLNNKVYLNANDMVYFIHSDTPNQYE